MSLPSGLASHVNAFRLLASDRTVRRLATIPFLINVVLFMVGVPIAIWQVLRLVDGWLGEWSGAGEIVAVVLKIVAVIAVVFASLLLFALIGSIVAGPFSGPLSEAVEKVERERRGLPPLPPESRGILTDVRRGVLYAIGRLLVFILIYPFIFLVNFIPVVGPPLHAALAFLYAAFVLSVDFSDPILDRKLDTFRRKLRYILDRKPTYLGFGAGAFGLMFVPFLNLMMIPVCVVAATILYVEGEAEGDANARV